MGTKLNRLLDALGGGFEAMRETPLVDALDPAKLYSGIKGIASDLYGASDASAMAKGNMEKAERAEALRTLVKSGFRPKGVAFQPTESSGESNVGKWAGFKRGADIGARLTALSGPLAEAVEGALTPLARDKIKWGTFDMERPWKGPEYEKRGSELVKALIKPNYAADRAVTKVLNAPLEKWRPSVRKWNLDDALELANERVAKQYGMKPLDAKVDWSSDMTEPISPFWYPDKGKSFIAAAQAHQNAPTTIRFSPYTYGVNYPTEFNPYRVTQPRLDEIMRHEYGHAAVDDLVNTKSLPVNPLTKNRYTGVDAFWENHNHGPLWESVTKSVPSRYAKPYDFRLPTQRVTPFWANMSGMVPKVGLSGAKR